MYPVDSWAICQTADIGPKGNVRPLERGGELLGGGEGVISVVAPQRPRAANVARVPGLAQSPNERRFLPICTTSALPPIATE